MGMKEHYSAIGKSRRWSQSSRARGLTCPPPVLTRRLTGVNVDRPNQIRTSLALGGQGRKVVLNPASFVANTAGTYGNTRPYEFLGPTYYDVDGAITRFFPIHEAVQLEFRSECFDCLNHPNLPGPTVARNSSLFGQITTTTPYTPRILQFSLKLDF